MTHLWSVAALAVASLVPWGPTSAPPDACTLVTLQEADSLIGPPLALQHTASSATFSTCNYVRPAQNPLDIPPSVEIHYWLLADVPTAQAKFQQVLHPSAMTGTTITAVPGLGDEADIKRTPSYHLNSVEFRRGTAIVTIGVSPLVSDSALIGAGKTALGRL